MQQKHKHYVFRRYDYYFERHVWKFEFIADSYQEVKEKLDELLKALGHDTKNSELYELKECFGSCHPQADVK